MSPPAGAPAEAKEGARAEHDVRQLARLSAANGPKNTSRRNEKNHASFARASQSGMQASPQSGMRAELAPQSGMSTHEVFGDPAWKEERASSDNSVLVTPCQPIELRLLEVRIPWEPSGFVEESDRKNIFFEAKNVDVVAFLQRVEDTLAEEGGWSTRVWQKRECSGAKSA